MSVTRIAWYGFAATALAAILGGLSLQAHVVAGSDLGGALDVSADQASWATTAGAAAEGVAVLIAAPLSVVFGARRVIIVAASASGAMALGVLLLGTDMALTVALSFSQGLACGLLPVVMMVWVMRAFAPNARSLPLMLLAFASSFPSAAAALAAGIATDHWGGSGVYVADVIWAPMVVAVALVALPREPAEIARLKSLDWLGFSLLAGAVLLLLIYLTQGERRFWLETNWIGPLIRATIALLALAVAWLLSAKAPYLDLGLFIKPTFAVAIALALSLRFGVLMASFAVPRALVRLQGFRPEQAGEALIWLAAGQCAGFPLAYLWLSFKDPRWALGFGLCAFALAALFAAQIEPAWSVEQFRPLMILVGFGQGFFLASVLAIATWDVPATAGATAAALFNLTRVLGTSGATALVGYFLRIRENEHSARLSEFVTTSSEAANLRIEQLTSSYAGLTPDSAAAQGAAMADLARQVTNQAFTLAFSDVFLGIATILIVSVLLLSLLPRLPIVMETSDQ
jgi:MFS transporter, DHA2 family, multidrug resistance protein